MYYLSEIELFRKLVLTMSCEKLLEYKISIEYKSIPKENDLN